MHHNLKIDNNILQNQYLCIRWGWFKTDKHLEDEFLNTFVVNETTIAIMKMKQNNPNKSAMNWYWVINADLELQC